MKELYSFDGRINRKTFWCRGIIILILLIADYVGFFVLVTFVTGTELAEMVMMITAMILLAPVYLILGWAGMANAGKRVMGTLPIRAKSTRKYLLMANRRH